MPLKYDRIISNPLFLYSAFANTHAVLYIAVIQVQLLNKVLQGRMAVQQAGAEVVRRSCASSKLLAAQVSLQAHAAVRGIMPRHN